MSASNVGTPSKRTFSATVDKLSSERLQIDTDLLLIITSTSTTFPGVPTSMTLKSKNSGF